MSERLLKKSEIAERFATSWQTASRLLAAQGVMPIDLGRGRGKGLRWLESGVQAALLALHRASQPKPQKPRVHTPGLSMPLHKMSVSAIQSLIAKGHPVQ